jgi:hypothetical protein
MDSNNIPADFISCWFELRGVQYKMAYSPEFQVNRGELDFTGNFMGILISSKRGTQSFLESQHPDKIFDCAKLAIETAPVNFPEALIFHSFEFDGCWYKLVMAPEFGAWEEDEGLDFTGCYEGMLISNKTGTLMFQAEPSGDDYEVMGDGIEAGLKRMISNACIAARKMESVAEKG